jgi:mono/diheme cytochrome c family protein
MSSTLSIVLGLTFVLLGITAVMLQAWLWGFPMENGHSTAPRLWTRIHRVVGLSFVAIYITMMIFMVPRLWEYQVELPARTVIHAVAAMVIGVLLLTKMAIIRLFPHFMGALPLLGLGLLINTVVLGSLSLPYALRAHNLSGDTLSAQNLERVRGVLADLPLPDDVDAAALATPERLADGREVLTRKCTVCHDMRTILAKPRSGPGWFNVVVRMAEKPLIMGDPLDDRDLPLATAYLIAITPDMQQSAKVRKKAMKDQAVRVAEVADMPADTAATPDTTTPDAAKAAAIYKARCTQCHELDEVTGHGGDDEAGWAKVVKRMVEDEGAELGEDEARAIVRFLAATYKKSA